MISKNNHNMGILENISEFSQTTQTSNSGMPFKYPEKKTALPDNDSDKSKCVTDQISDTSKKKLQLSFSVDRLLSNDKSHRKDVLKTTEMCCATLHGCCTNVNCTVDRISDVNQTNDNKILQMVHGVHPFDETYFSNGSMNVQQIGYQTDSQSVIRPKPLRAMSGKCGDEPASSKLPSLLKFHHEQPHYQMERNIGPIMNYFNTTHKSNNMHMDVPTISNLNLSTQPSQQQFHQSSAQVLHVPLAFENTVGIAPNYNGNASKNLINSQVNISTNSGKRKRSWSRAVFSNLQRKGLEIQFQQQKYITKPDRRKLAARLNLTDAQVKVWFQNRRMKWRHTRENLKSGQEKQMHHIDKNRTILATDQLCYSSDSSSSLCPSENEEDNEIDVTG